MKKIIIFIFAMCFTSCQVEKEEKRGPLEGVWERTGTIIFKNNRPADTLPMADEQFQTKVFTQHHALWLGNRKNLDSLGNDREPGGGIYSRQYSVVDGVLTEFLTSGSDRMENWFKSNMEKDENGNYPISFKVIINENSYYQMWGLDSLGNGNAELYKRVE
tara:strand:+ start:3406 stop:3888 length:483 start_codon:yes stop_codon:yes gene_type:complete